MTNEEIQRIFEECGALLSGHFLLSSGLHSDQYVQCARVFEHPPAAEKLCSVLVQKLTGINPTIVMGPAVGAITMAYEMSRQLGVPNVFAERVNGVLQLRRGLAVPTGSRVLLVEDVVTTGGSVRELYPIVEAADSTVAAVGSLVDRSGGSADFSEPFFSVLKIDVRTFDASACPLCAAGSAPEEPGSRRLR